MSPVINSSFPIKLMIASCFSLDMRLFILSIEDGEPVSSRLISSSKRLTIILNDSERPLILPIYLSAPASNFAAMSSYSNFCFMQYIRLNAFRTSDQGSFSNGVAEQCYRFSQNLPTVILLLPRAALCLAVLLTFSNASPAAVASGNAGNSARDSTFFNGDGALTSYARGILIFNCVWIIWRVFLLLASW